MFIWRINVVFLSVLHFSSAADDIISDETVALIFEDNLIDEKFTPFAKTNYRLSRTLNFDVTPLRHISSIHHRRLVDKFRLDDVEEFYTLKLHYKRRSAENYLMTSIPLCLILQFQLQYTLTLFLNENGFIIGTQIFTKNSTCHRTNLLENTELIYRVTVQFQRNEMGPQPETQQFLEKFKREQEAKMIAQESDNRSFLLKYWKYILPIAVIVILQTVFTDQASTGGR